MKQLLRIIKNEYIYSIVSKIFSVLIGIIQTSLVARYLGASLQGVSSYIASVISIGSIIVTFGIHQAYAYMRKNKGKSAVYVSFLSVTYVMFIIYMLGAVVCTICGTMTLEIKIAILLIPIYGYDRVVAYVCLIENPNQKNSIWLLVGVLEVFFVIILNIFVHKSIYVSILILLFPEVIKSIIYTHVLNVKPVFDKRMILLAFELLKYGLLPMLALLMTTLNYKIDILMLRSYDFITEEQVGIYSIGMLWVDKIALIPDTLKGVLASKLAKGANSKEVAKVARICFGVSILISFAILVLGKKIIYFLYGVEYMDAYQVILACAFGSIFIGFFKLIAQYNIVNKKQIRNIVLLSGSVFINIILNFILIPKFQLIGAALASGIGYFMSGVVFVVWFSRQNNIKLRKMFFVQKDDLINIRLFKEVFKNE